MFYVKHYCVFTNSFNRKNNAFYGFYWVFEMIFECMVFVATGIMDRFSREMGVKLERRVRWHGCMGGTD